MAHVHVVSEQEPAAEAPASPLPQRQPGRRDVRTIAEAALLLDVTVLLVLLRVFLPIPFVQGVVRLACPAPFVLLALRRGARTGLVATVAALILLSTFIGPVLAVQQIVVFGGIGTLFAWASKRGWPRAPTIVVGASLYGIFYLLLPFLFGLAVLRIDLGKTLHDVHKNAESFLSAAGHFHLGVIPVSAPLVAALSGSPIGRGLLDLLHGAALGMLSHPLATLVVFFALYSLVNVWAYLVVSVELYRHLPIETRRDPEGQAIDFFPFR